MPRECKVGSVSIGAARPLAVIAGPCVLESRELGLAIGQRVRDACHKEGLAYVFKASFDKANRSSIRSARGPGLQRGLDWIASIGESLRVPVTTDIHEPAHAAPAAACIDLLQIPAFLCRQTDLLCAAGEAATANGRGVNVKKGQFLAPWDMRNVIQKVRDAGNDRVMACDRGTSFGYNTLVSDFRGLPTMAEQCRCPVVFDATHSVQQPGGQGGSSGGQREFVAVLARAAVAVGVAGLFIETHQDPDDAPCDGPNMVPLHQMPALLERLMAYDSITKGA